MKRGIWYKTVLSPQPHLGITILFSQHSHPLKRPCQSLHQSGFSRTFYPHSCPNIILNLRVAEWAFIHICKGWLIFFNARRSGFEAVLAKSLCTCFEDDFEFQACGEPKTTQRLVCQLPIWWQVCQIPCHVGTAVQLWEEFAILAVNALNLAKPGSGAIMTSSPPLMTSKPFKLFRTVSVVFSVHSCRVEMANSSLK